MSAPIKQIPKGLHCNVRNWSFFSPPFPSTAGLWVAAACSCFTDCPPAVGTTAQMARRSSGGWTPPLIKCCCASAEGNLLVGVSRRAFSLTELPLNSEKCLPLFKQGRWQRARLLCRFFFFFFFPFLAGAQEPPSNLDLGLPSASSRRLLWDALFIMMQKCFCEEQSQRRPPVALLTLCSCRGSRCILMGVNTSGEKEVEEEDGRGVEKLKTLSSICLSLALMRPSFDLMDCKYNSHQPETPAPPAALATSAASEIPELLIVLFLYTEKHTFYIILFWNYLKANSLAEWNRQLLMVTSQRADSHTQQEVSHQLSAWRLQGRLPTALSETLPCVTSQRVPNIWSD